VGLEQRARKRFKNFDKVTIPHGGLRTETSQTTYKTHSSVLSPSHTVGLEQYIKRAERSGKLESPSHTVGLEPTEDIEDFLSFLLSPSHAVGLEQLLLKTT